MKWYRVSFIYKGAIKEVILQATNKTEAILIAKELNKGLVIEVKEITIPLKEKFKILKDIFLSKVIRRRLDHISYISALRELAILLKAGISLKDALKDIGDNTSNKLIKNIFLQAALNIDGGKNLSYTFKIYEQYVGKISIAMIKLGEKSGDLEYAINALADIFEKIYENKKKFLKAIRYPLITFIGIVLAFSFVIVLVIPKFQSIFDKLNASLPFPTKVLLNIEYFISNYGIVVVFISLFLFLLVLFSYTTFYKFKYFFDKILLKTPFRKIILFSTFHRFLKTLFFLMKSGISLLDSLKISLEIIENEFIKEKVNYVIIGIKQGKSFTNTLKENNLLNFITLRMINSGENSGEMVLMLENASKYYEDKFDDIIDNMQGVIEPMMLIIAGGFILLLALGIFMPMWDLANAIKHSM